MSRNIAPTNQWTEANATLPTMEGGILVALADGGWAVDPSAGPDAGLAAVSGGGVGADDALTTGLPLIVRGTSALTY